MNNIQATIEGKIAQHLEPEYFEVVNESSKHNVPPNSESHFKVTVVSQHFEGRKLIGRHRMLNKLLADELATVVHALSLNTLTPQEWRDRHGEIPATPPCLGGSSQKP